MRLEMLCAGVLEIGARHAQLKMLFSDVIKNSFCTYATFLSCMVL
jgi:hypothetical protein